MDSKKLYGILFILVAFILLSSCHFSPKTYDEVDKTNSKNWEAVEKAKSEGNYEEVNKLYTVNIELIKDFLSHQNDSTQVGKLLNRAFIINYEGRANGKMKLKDFAGAISDFSNAISLNENAQSNGEKLAGIHSCYYERGVAKFELGGNGCDDLIKANELRNNLYTTKNIYEYDKYMKRCTGN